MILPDLYFDSVFDVPYKELWQKQIRGLIFDIDNTLTAFDEDLPPPKTIALLNHLQKIGFKLCFVTNNTNNRLLRFNKHMNIPAVANALKPLTRGVKKAMHMMGTTTESTAIIGDQLLSDIWAGKRANILTILIKPITDRDFWFVKIKRVIERVMLRGYK